MRPLAAYFFWSNAQASRVRRSTLQARGMAGLETARRSIFKVPARSESIVTIIPSRRVESQASYHREGVTILRIDRDPLPAAVPAVMQEVAGAHRHPE